MRRFSPIFILLAICSGLWPLRVYGQNAAGAAADTADRSGNGFLLAFNRQGLSSLRKADDVFPTDYIQKGRGFGAFSMLYQAGGDTSWHAYSSADDWEPHLTAGKDHIASYIGGKQAGLASSVVFDLDAAGLTYHLTIRNQAKIPVTIGSLAFPLHYNRLGGEDPKVIFEESVLKHHFISANGSYVFFERPTGMGPYLVLTPLEGTSLEYDDMARASGRGQGQVFRMFIHSLAEKGNAQGTWRQPQSSLKLGVGDSVRYGFKFRWANDYQGVHDIIYEEGMPDINIVPGMTIPNDLFARFSVRSKKPLGKIAAEFPDKTEVKSLGNGPGGVQLFEVRFHKLGENRLTVHYGKGEKTYLEFFSTEPLATLYHKRAAFMTDKQQHKVPDKWYDGLFSQWDMRTGVLRGPDDTDGFDGWWGYVLACDDPGLCKAPFLAAMNLYYPDQHQIDAIEYYLKNFVWGKLQRTDQETPFPYGVYGVPNWKENRDPQDPKEKENVAKGRLHVWRTFDYAHITMLYFHMYQLASRYPNMVHYLDKKGYLIRAKETAKALFTNTYGGEKYTWACYNELLLVDLIDALNKEGFTADADTIRGEWEKKVKYFIYDDPYPYRSEYSVDATAFESTQAFAHYAMTHTMAPDSNLWYNRGKKKWYSHPRIDKADAANFMERQLQANIALRGWVENAYYLKGSDFRGKSDSYLLSYMAQMGGWGVMDYALNFAKDSNPYLQLGYASYLSSFALMNTGTPESNYGYWFPGKQNDGASGWAFEPMRHSRIWIRKETDRGIWMYDGEIDLGYAGAMRTAATVLANDPVFGWFAYGGLFSKAGGQYIVSPKDGLQVRFNYVNGKDKLAVQVVRDGFRTEGSIVLSETLDKLLLKMENRTGDSHQQTLQLEGLKPGHYQVMVNGKMAGEAHVTAGEKTSVQVDVPASDYDITLAL